MQNLKLFPLIISVISALACAPSAAPEEQSTSDLRNCGVSGVLCASRPLYTSDIGMWYTLWWRRPGTDLSGVGTSWNIASRYRPLSGYYTSAEQSVFRTERSQFQAMKLDFLLLDHSNGVGANANQLRQAGERVRNALSGQREIQYATAIGAALWAQSSPNYGAHASEVSYVWNNLSNPAAWPNAYRTRQNKPLLVLYTAAGAGDTWSDGRFTVGAATGSMSQASSYQRSQGLHGWVSDLPNYRSNRSMVVMPGWGTSHLCAQRQLFPYHSCRAIGRRRGREFMDQWLRAIDQNPERIVIASWNDFGEETAIQPARRLAPKPHHAGARYPAETWIDAYGTETPTFYYEIAKVYSLMRWGLMHGAYVRAKSNVAVYKVLANGLEYQTTMPRGRPVVVVPDGYLDQFPRASASCTPVPSRLSPGLFKVGARVYYTNGSAYCYCDNSSPSTSRAYCSTPSGQANHGNCSGC